MHFVNAPSNKSVFRSYLTENNLFLLACVLCGLPVWLPHFPPMVDLPQHAAQVSLFLNLGNPDFPFSDQFQRNLFTPYLLGYLLISAITPIFGILTASKLVIWLALATFALSSRYLLNRTGADPYWSWLTFPVLYGFTYQWGLLSFLIAVPVGIFTLGLIWRNPEKNDWQSSLFIALMLNILFYCHALVMGLVIVIALGFWIYSAKNLRNFLLSAWPIITLTPMVIIWLLLTARHPQTSMAIDWDLSWINTMDGYYTYFADWADKQNPGWGRATGFIPRLLGVRPSPLFTLTGIILFALPFLAGGRIASSRIRLLPLIAITLVLIFLPSTLFGNVFTVERFVYLAMPLFLIMIDISASPGRIQQFLRWSAPMIAFGWIAYMSINALQFNREADGFQNILSKMEPNNRAISLIFSRDDSHSIAPTFIHFPAWYSAIKNGVTNPSFAETYIEPVTYKKEYIPKANFQGFAWNPQLFNWPRHEGYQYDYFVVRAPVDVGAFIFRTAPCRIQLVAQSQKWWLYRPAPECR